MAGDLGPARHVTRCRRPSGMIMVVVTMLPLIIISICRGVVANQT